MFGRVPCSFFSLSLPFSFVFLSFSPLFGPFFLQVSSRIPETYAHERY